jgi:hypothetical protein
VTQIWPAISSRHSIPGSSQSGYPADLDNIAVSEGDMIRFEVHAGSNGTSNLVSWTPSIGYVNRRH